MRKKNIKAQGLHVELHLHLALHELVHAFMITHIYLGSIIRTLERECLLTQSNQLLKIVGHENLLVRPTAGNGNLLPITVSTSTVALTGTVTSNGESLTSFTHNQTTTATSWTITHNMGKNPSVTIVDSANSYVIGEVDYINNNSLTVSFKSAFKGKAYLN